MGTRSESTSIQYKKNLTEFRYDGIQLDQPQRPNNPGWAAQAAHNGFVDGSSYANPDIICHKGAVAGTTHAIVNAGGKVRFQWNPWPKDHESAILVYLANCHGPCEQVDKTQLEWFKIKEDGLSQDLTSPAQGNNPPMAKFALQAFLAQGSTWTADIPGDITAGNYVARMEIITLFLASNINGAQHYPYCYSLEITGGGTANPQGVRGMELYKNTDPGLLINIFNPIGTYHIPGPPLYIAGSSPSGTSSPASSFSSVDTTSSTTSVSSTVDAQSTGSSSTTSSSAQSSETPSSSSVTDSQSSAMTSTTSLAGADSYQISSPSSSDSSTASAECTAEPTVTVTSVATVTVVSY